MNYVTSQITQLRIAELNSLDPINVMIEDLEPGKGRITITCYGSAWVAYRGGMGGKTISQFFCSSDEDYLAKNLSEIDQHQIDYEKISLDLGEEVCKENIYFHEDQMELLYGDIACRQLPREINPCYAYLCRIIKAVQQALEDLGNWE